MYEFGAQSDHEKPFLSHFEDFTERFRNLGNELEDKDLEDKDIYRKIYENISSVILQAFLECG